MPGGCNLGPRPIDQHLKAVSYTHLNHGMLEDCYGINLRHLQRMAEQFYGEDDLSIWMPHTDAARGLSLIHIFWLALLVAVLAGLATGLVTGLLHTFMGIPAILADRKSVV